MSAIVARMPLWLRKAIVDFASVLIAGVLALQVAAPQGSWREWSVAAGAAVLNVALNALRRSLAGNLPDALAWLAQILQTGPTPPAGS